jgi:hypothetical protein
MRRQQALGQVVKDSPERGAVSHAGSRSGRSGPFRARCRRERARGRTRRAVSAHGTGSACGT